MASTLKSFFDLGFTVEGIEQATQPSRKDEELYGVALLGAVFSTIASLLAVASILLGVAAAMHFLRNLKNPTFWQVACWALMVIGILARQLFSENHRLDFNGLSPSLAISSAIVGLAVLPLLMRWLNRVSHGPNIEQVATPFALGFFLDYAQVLASTYVVHLPWVTRA